MRDALCSIELKKLTLCALTAVLLLAGVGVSAFAASGDNTGLNVQEEQYKKDTQIEAKDAEAKALEQVPGLLTNAQVAKVATLNPERRAIKTHQPKNATAGAKAKTQAQQAQAGNNAGDIARDQAVQAIDYASRYMKNFTTDGGNRWNRALYTCFMPMALLLLLPGAVLTQVRAIIAQGNPVVGRASPLEGIQRAIIGIFLIPATYLVVNYSIDLGNSIHYTIATEYKRIQGTDMYEDAMCAEIRAFGTRSLAENEGSMTTPVADLAPRGNEPFAKLEGRLWGKLADPCKGLMLVPANRDDASMPQGSVGVRMMMNASNAGVNTAWSILCAFQMAYFYYLFMVGPIMAALWVWPNKMFRDAFPSWVEGVVTLAFWSFFWNVTILILALTKSEASTGLFMVTAINVLATASVKHAFDFAGLLRGAVGQAESIGAKAAAQAAKGGGQSGGGKSGGKSGGKKSAPKEGAPEAPAAKPAQVESPTRVAAVAPIANPVVAEHDEEKPAVAARVPAVLKAKALPAMRTAVVNTSLPPVTADSLNEIRFAANDPTVIEGIEQSSQWRQVPIFNKATGLWMDPTGKLPPSAQLFRMFSRDSVDSNLGNSIQPVMAYPTNIPLVDPDTLLAPEAAIENIEQIEVAQEVAQSVEAENQTEITNAEETETKEDAEMNSTKSAQYLDEKFSVPPPPMTTPSIINRFDYATSVSDIPMEAVDSKFSQELLLKLAEVANEVENFEPAVAMPASQAMPAFLHPIASAANYDQDMHQAWAEEAEVVTVVDYTAFAAKAVEAQQAVRNNAASPLANVLGNRGWAQKKAAAEPQNLATGWWS